MADVNANIGVNIDTSKALAQLKALQRQISQFHTSIARSSESAALAQRSLQKNLIGSINSIGAFSAELRTVRTSAETFTNSLEKNKFSMREYFRYAGASTKTFGRLFKTEFDTIGKVAEERVKTLQTQYIKMGRNASGAMEAIAVRPTTLNMQDYGVKTAIAAQKQALFNQLMKQGTTNLLNFGKNTQWAGRQLMVGFTIPLSILGTTAARTFMEMEAQTIKFRKVYGDLFTPKAETQAALDSITELAKQFTQYGVAVSQTVGLAAEAAAAGFQGLDLQRQTIEATRLSVLGQIDSQKALETTISLQNAFGMSSDKLADSINFLNAVENQTVVSLDDITTAIPKVAPVIQQLGGDVKDLTFFIAAMKEGGINASEGANALKSGLAALINPTDKASNMLKGFGINATAIIEKNKGDLKATVLEFANALNTLDPLSRARAIEQMFGKFQFARLSTLFANVAKDGNQASRVLDLANASVQELSELSEQELGLTADSSMNKFRKSVEDLKLALVPVGKAFLEAATPIVEFVGNVLEKFGNLSDGTKRLITLLTVGIGAVGPVLLMTFGLLANALANGLKGVLLLRKGYLAITGQSKVLGEQTQYLNSEQLEAAAVAHSLDQTHAKLTQTFNLETQALVKLIAAYQSAGRAAKTFAFNNPGMMMPTKPRKFASGGEVFSVPGSGNQDTVPAMLTPGEIVVPKRQSKKYGGLLQGIIADNIPGYQKGAIGSGSSGRIGKSRTTVVRPYTQNVSSVGGLVSFTQIDPTNVADVTSIYAKEILSSAKISLSSINKEIMNWERTNAGAIRIATKAVNEGTSSTQAFSGLINKFNQDMEMAQGPFSKFSKTAQKMLPELQKDLIEAQTKAKQLSLNIKNSADATKLAQALPNNIVAQSLAQPGFFGNLRRVRAGAAAKFGGVGGMGKYGIPRFMVDPTTEPSSRAYGLATSQEHFSTTMLQQANLESQKVLRKQSKRQGQGHGAYMIAGIRRAQQARYNREDKALLEAMGMNIGNTVVNATARAAATTSPSKKTRRVGQDIARGLEVGMTDRTKNVAAAGGNLSQQALLAAQSQARLYGGAPIDAITKSFRRQQEKLAKATPTIIPPTPPTGRGRFSGMGGRGLMGIGTATMAASMLPGRAGEIGMKIGGLAFVAQSLAMLPGPLKLVAVAFGGLYGITKLLNAAKEKERQAIEGIGRAANLSTTQIEKLGEILGFTPVKSNLEFAKPQVSGLSPVQSQQVEQLTKTLKEDKEFQNQVKGLSVATKEQAEAIFKSLSIRLSGQGATKEAIQNYIYALQQEAGRLDVSFSVNSIDLTTKEGQAGLRDAATKLVNDFNFAFAKGYKTTKVRSRATGEIVEIGEASDELKQKLSSASQIFSSFFMGIETQLATGKISADQFTESFNQISNSIKQMPKAQGMMVLSEMLKTMPSEIAKAAVGIKDMNTRFKVLEATMLGVYITESMLNQLIIKSTEGGADRAKGRVDRYLNERIAKAKLAKEAIAKLIGTGTGTGGAGKKEEPFDQYQKQFSVVNNFFNAQENLIKQQRKSKENALQAEIDLAEEAVKSAEKRIDTEQKLVDINQRQIDLLNRRIELEFDRPIQKLQDESAILNNNLEIIRNQEDAINDQYDKQLDALEKISSANNKIANQEKSRLNIASALTSGDVAAAAQAVQEARAQAAASQLENQRKAIEDSRKQAIAGVTAGGMTKDQIEARTYQIGQQTFLLEQQRKILQNEITILQDKNYNLEQGIYSIKQTSLIPAQAQVDKAREALDSYNKQTVSLTSGILLLGKTQEQWALTDAKIVAANASLAAQESKLENIFKLMKNIKNLYNKTTNLPGVNPFVPPATSGASSSTFRSQVGFFDRFKMYGGKINYMAYGGTTPPMNSDGRSQIAYMPFGGLIPYMKNGGFRSMGSDIVPAMLTPGEFVMNKASTKQFLPLLSMLNESKYPSMIGPSYSSSKTSPSKTSFNNNSRNVYNYNVGINVGGTNASANNIAKAVMDEIKYLDKQRIRGQRVS